MYHPGSPFRNEGLTTPLGRAASKRQTVFRHQPFWEIALAEEIRDMMMKTMRMMLSVKGGIKELFNIDPTFSSLQCC